MRRNSVIIIDITRKIFLNKYYDTVVHTFITYTMYYMYHWEQIKVS